MIGGFYFRLNFLLKIVDINLHFDIMFLIQQTYKRLIMRQITLSNGEDWILGDNVAICANTKGVFHIDMLHVSVAIRAIKQDVADEIERIYHTISRKLKVDSLDFYSLNDLECAKEADKDQLFLIAVDTSNVETMCSLIQYGDSDALLALVNFNRKFERNSQLLDIIVEKFGNLGSSYQELQRAIAQTPTGALSNRAIDILLKTNNEKVIIDLIKNDKVPSEKLTHLIKSENVKIRSAMAELADIPNKVRSTLLKDVKAVRLSFAMRSDLTDKEAEILVKDSDKDVRNTVNEFHFS